MNNIDKNKIMEQSAVEWLYNNLLPNPISNEDIEYNEVVFENAKEMFEKQQMEFANWCRIQDNKYTTRVLTIQQLLEKFKNK